MNQLRIALTVVVLLTFAAAAVAAGPATGAAKRPSTSADVVEVKVVPAGLMAKPGAEVAFTVHLDIADTWHLYDHQYAEDPESFFIGVDLVPGPGANLAGFSADFPVGEQGTFMGDKVVMLHHQAAILVKVKLPEDAFGTVDVPLVLTAQACDDKLCLQPSDITVTASIEVQ
jgi:hypothetical protein